MITSILSPRKPFAILLFCVLFVTSCKTTGDQILHYQSDRGKELVAEHAMVASAHPLASEAGLKMLKKGGNAVDAAVATAFALNVVEPNMSGIGGGGSMLIWDDEKKEAKYADFYTAKLAETYRNIDYSQYEDGEFTLLGTGIPGTVDGLLQALEKYGTLSREEVMAPAIAYATEGFPVYPTLANFIYSNEEKLDRYEGARDTFWPGGEPLQAGEVLKQPELAKTLQRISDGGADAFYKSDITDDVIKVLNDAGNPVTRKDFADFEPQWNKTPLCGTYKDYQVFSAPLPQTGTYIIQALNVLENYDLKSMGLPTVSAEAFDVLSSTMRLSLADRREYITDPNWEDIPVEGLISKEYANERRKLVDGDSVPETIEFGVPSTTASASVANGCPETEMASLPQKKVVRGDELAFASNTFSYEKPANYDEAAGTGETTHISVIDADGNAVSFSTTLSPVFGSGAWVDGFMLNSSGFNFKYLTTEGDWESSHPYRIRASTISPTIILEDGEVRLVIGAPGGGRIPTAVLQNIVYILDYGLDPLDAVKMPRIFPSSQNTGVQLEKGFDHNVLKEVREMGYDPKSLSSGYARLYLVYRKDGKLIGVSDTRHDGEPRGY